MTNGFVPAGDPSELYTSVGAIVVPELETPRPNVELKATPPETMNMNAA